MAEINHPKTKIMVGTAGWDYPDWKGIFYTSPRPKSMHPLEYYASFFDTVEVNSTFYRPIRSDFTETWIRRVSGNRNFTFTVKLWQRFTHQRETPFTEHEVQYFRSSLAPLQEAGLLGGLLIQFPWSFRNLPENRDWLQRLMEAFGDYPRVVEVRHASWNLPEVFSLFQQYGVAFCNIDQPLFHRSLIPSDRVTAPLGYVRLHGQNHADWFRAEASRNDRYNYLYKESELIPWVEKIRAMQAKTERLYIITNNHYRGQAAVNAFQLLHLLTGKKVKAPACLGRAYADLRGIMEPWEGQQNLPGF